MTEIKSAENKRQQLTERRILQKDNGNVAFRQRNYNSGVNGSVTLGGWIDAKGKVSWGTEVTQWGPRAKTQ